MWEERPAATPRAFSEIIRAATALDSSLSTYSRSGQTFPWRAPIIWVSRPSWLTPSMFPRCWPAHS